MTLWQRFKAWATGVTPAAEAPDSYLADFDLETATLEQLDAVNIQLGQGIDEIRAARREIKARADVLREGSV